MIYWDTSALLKLYAPEADSGLYLRQMIAQSSGLAISYLHQVELYFALHAKESRGEIVSGSASFLAHSFERHVAEGRYIVVPWGSDVIERSRAVLDDCLAADPSIVIRSLDGLHLGAVLAAGVTHLITADERMKSAAKAVGIDLVHV